MTPEEEAADPRIARSRAAVLSATVDLLGEVGTTGRSTGNHLHWDMLVGTTWVDGLAWLEEASD